MPERPLDEALEQSTNKWMAWGVGIMLAMLLSRFLSGLLVGISPNDPVTLVGIGLLLSGVAVVASYVPARRAARVDPMVALRYE